MSILLRSGVGEGDRHSTAKHQNKNLAQVENIIGISNQAAMVTLTVKAFCSGPRWNTKQFFFFFF